MTNREAQFKSVKIQLQNLQHFISHSESAQGYLVLFDEFVREYEFSLALETLCDFLREKSSPVDDTLLTQIERLHNDMKVKDSCVEKLREISRHER